MGGNLLRGLKGSGIQKSVIFGVLVVRYLALPLVGIAVVKGALRFGLVPGNPLYEFILLLQFAVPPAMNIGTITQLFGAGEMECSVIMLCCYSLASLLSLCGRHIFCGSSLLEHNHRGEMDISCLKQHTTSGNNGSAA